MTGGKWKKGSGTARCPHAVYPVVVCSRCVQVHCPPHRIPTQPSADPGTRPGEKRPEAWRAVLPDGTEHTYPDTPRRLAAITLRRHLGVRRLPKGTEWEPIERLEV